jgi:hypothetical protein
MALPSYAASPESLWSKFSRSTGLLEGLLTIVGVRKDVAPIEICPSSGGGAGYISAARAIAASRGVEIYGNVQTTLGYEAPLHAHVDIFFRLKDGKISPEELSIIFRELFPPTLEDRSLYRTFLRPLTPYLSRQTQSSCVFTK